MVSRARQACGEPLPAIAVRAVFSQGRFWFAEQPTACDATTGI